MKLLWLVEERHDIMHYSKVEARTTNVDTETHSMNIDANYSESFDDDDRLNRTTSSHIITVVIGSGVLSLAWAVGLLGWIAGPTMMILFALVILYTSNLLVHYCSISEHGIKCHMKTIYVDFVEHEEIRGSLTGISIGTLTSAR